MERPAPPTRQLGRDGPRIPAIGFGLMGMSIGYGLAEYANPHPCPVIKLVADFTQLGRRAPEAPRQGVGDWMYQLGHSRRLRRQ